MVDGKQKIKGIKEFEAEHPEYKGADLGIAYAKYLVAIPEARRLIESGLNKEYEEKDKEISEGLDLIESKKEDLKAKEDANRAKMQELITRREEMLKAIGTYKEKATEAEAIGVSALGKKKEYEKKAEEADAEKTKYLEMKQEVELEEEEVSQQGAENDAYKDHLEKKEEELKKQQETLDNNAAAMREEVQKFEGEKVAYEAVKTEIEADDAELAKGKESLAAKEKELHGKENAYVFVKRATDQREEIVKKREAVAKKKLESTDEGLYQELDTTKKELSRMERELVKQQEFHDEEIKRATEGANGEIEDIKKNYDILKSNYDAKEAEVIQLKVKRDTMSAQGADAAVYQEKEDEIKRKGEELKRHASELKTIRDAVKAKEAEIAAKETDVYNKGKAVAYAEEQNKLKEQELANKEKELSARKPADSKAMLDYAEKLQTKEKELKELEADLAAKEEGLKQDKKIIDELQAKYKGGAKDPGYELLIKKKEEELEKKEKQLGAKSEYCIQKELELRGKESEVAKYDKRMEEAAKKEKRLNEREDNHNTEIAQAQLKAEKDIDAKYQVEMTEARKIKGNVDRMEQEIKQLRADLETREKEVRESKFKFSPKELGLSSDSEAFKRTLQEKGLKGEVFYNHDDKKILAVIPKYVLGDESKEAIADYKLIMGLYEGASGTKSAINAPMKPTTTFESIIRESKKPQEQAPLPAVRPAPQIKPRVEPKPASIEEDTLIVDLEPIEPVKAVPKKVVKKPIESTYTFNSLGVNDPKMFKAIVEKKHGLVEDIDYKFDGSAVAPITDKGKHAMETRKDEYAEKRLEGQAKKDEGKPMRQPIAQDAEFVGIKSKDDYEKFVRTNSLEDGKDVKADYNGTSLWGKPRIKKVVALTPKGADALNGVLNDKAQELVDVSKPHVDMMVEKMAEINQRKKEAEERRKKRQDGQ